eukprot:gb/GEZN01003892.1/.p1 GENE.gb/GEZN01003892.1/~~gb/GEZN01003892.1/.p1  ORF type:complete len:540 (+),score=68.59 gb/GEZN01003892.1/:180-1622(+)
MLRFYEFNTMNRSLQSMREKEPHEGNQIRQVIFNARSDKFLVVTGGATPKIFDREGLEICMFKRGDMYLYDMHKTHGHVTGCTGGDFNPQSPDQCVTSGEDGTLRIWDVGRPSSNLHVIKLKGTNGKRCGVTACAYSRNGKWVAGSGVDGSIHVWDMRGRFLMPAKKCVKAHTPLSETSCLKFGPDQNRLLSRGADSTVKVWDLRQFKEPLKVLENLPNEYPQLDVLFSPNDSIILTGTANRKEGAPDTGQLVFFNASTFDEISRLNMSKHAITRIHWQASINHIFAGTAEGKTHVLYSPKLSQKGMLLAMGKSVKRKSFMDFIQPMDIRNPHALPMYKDIASRKKQKFLDRKKTAAPLAPKSTEPGKGVQGELATRSLTGHFMQQAVNTEIVQHQKHTDPREALLKFAEIAAKDPMFMGRAYGLTQPKPIFAQPDEENLAKEGIMNETLKELSAKRDAEMLNPDAISMRGSYGDHIGGS